VTPASSNYSYYGGQERLTLANSSSITALAITVRVAQTTGLTYNSSSNSFPGGDITEGSSTSGGVITYTYVLNSGKTIPSGNGGITYSQWNGTGSARSTSDDTWTVVSTSGGVTSTLSGTF
jgi:hypothetical protein